MLLYKLGYVTYFATIAFIGFYIRFLVYDHYYIITAYILLCHLCSIPPVSCSYLIMISLAIYLLAPVCLCPRHDFLCMFMIQFYRYTCAHFCTPSGIHITTCWGVLTPLDPHVQVLELGARGFSWLLI